MSAPATLPAQPQQQPPTPDAAAAQPVLPHHLTFAALINTFSKTYRWTRDEALRHSRENALAMRRDVWIMRCLRERKEAVAQLPWHLEPENSKDAQQKEVADRLTAIVKAVPHRQRLLMYLLDSTFYGVYGSQVIWEPKDVLGQRGLIVTRHIPVNGDKIQFGWDGVPRVYVNATHITDLEKQGGRIVRGDLAPMLLLDTPAWRERFIIHQHEVDDADYFEGEMGGAVHGVGIRGRIYWGVWMRDELLSWAVDYMQKVGTLGLVVFPYEAGNADGKKAAESEAEKASNRNALTMPVPAGQDPSKYMPVLLSPSTAGITALQQMISEYFNRHIELYIVGQTMSSGADKESGLGGSGRAEFAKDTKFNIIKNDARNLEETLTSDLIEPAKKWNCPGATFPVRWVFDVPDPEAEKKLEAGKVIFDMGLPIKTAELYGHAGYSQPTDDDDVVQLGPGQMGGGGDPFGGEPGGGFGDDDSGGEGPPAREADSDDGSDEPVGYAADDGGDGHWITIGAKAGEGDQQKHGGTPVYIQGGKIVRGPKGLVDKHLAELGKRQQQAQQQAFDVTKAAKQLEAMGFTPQEAKRYAEQTAAARQSQGKPAGDEPPPARDAKPASGLDALRDEVYKKMLEHGAILPAGAETKTSVASPQQQRRIDNLLAEAEKQKAKKGKADDEQPAAGDTNAASVQAQSATDHATPRGDWNGADSGNGKAAESSGATGQRPAGGGAGGKPDADPFADFDKTVSEFEAKKAGAAKPAAATDDVTLAEANKSPTGRAAEGLPRFQANQPVAERIAALEHGLAVLKGRDSKGNKFVLSRRANIRREIERLKALAGPPPAREAAAAAYAAEADQLRDQLAADLPAAPTDPEASARAKAAAARLREIDRERRDAA